MPDPTVECAPALEVVDGLAVLRVGAAPTFSRTVQQVAEAIRTAAAAGHRHLLLCVAGVHFAPPSIAARHAMVRSWAEASAGRVTVAVVARQEFIDPHRFGVVAAANFGLAGQVFEDEAQAREWLALMRQARHA